MDENNKSKKSKDKSLTDQWRDAERDAAKAERAAEAARDRANTLASSLAYELIENHSSACVELDGTKYTPKAGATRKLEGGNFKAPKYPYQLVRTKEKALVEI